MKHLRRLTSLFLLLTLSPVCFAQELTWYPFDRDFINARYSTSALERLAHAIQQRRPGER